MDNIFHFIFFFLIDMCSFELRKGYTPYIPLVEFIFFFRVSLRSFDTSNKIVREKHLKFKD